STRYRTGAGAYLAACAYHSLPPRFVSFFFHLLLPNPQPLSGSLFLRLLFCLNILLSRSLNDMRRVSVCVCVCVCAREKRYIYRERLRHPSQGFVIRSGDLTKFNRHFDTPPEKPSPQVQRGNQ